MAKRASEGRRRLLADYREIRAGIQRVLRAAQRSCGRPDLLRAAKRIGIEDLEDDELDDAATCMRFDIALFEANQRGVRPYDRFLEKAGGHLGVADRALADSIAGARFSIFRLAARHEVGGLWLEDLLNPGQRIWLMDEAFERNAPDDIAFGMRIFDAGPFHAGFGIVVPADDETVALCRGVAKHGMATPFRYSIAATLYGDHLSTSGIKPSVDLEIIEILTGMLDRLGDAAPAEPLPHAPAGGAPKRTGRAASRKQSVT